MRSAPADAGLWRLAGAVTDRFGGQRAYARRRGVVNRRVRKLTACRDAARETVTVTDARDLAAVFR